jgi:protease secretion system membrane fusion protein
MSILKKTEPATDVQTHNVETLALNTDAGAFARMGWIIVLLGVGGFLLWALFAPLDKGVPVQGTLAKESNRKTIQSFASATVEDILVKDGDVVKKGQVLVRMNPVVARSQAETARGQYITARATEARLQAELTGKPAMAFPPALAALKNDPRVVEAMSLQAQLFAARQGAQRDDLSATDASIAGLKSQIDSLKESREGMKSQLALLKEQLDNMRDLAKDGYVARNRMLDVERNYIQVNAQISEATGTIARNQAQVTEAMLRRAQRVQEYQREVRSSLSDIQRDAQSLEARLQQYDYELANVEVKAPDDGIVTGLAVFTRGGVVSGGAKIMEIVPTADAFIVEGQVPVNLIDRVRPGLKVDLNFSAFNTNKTPHIPGEVVQVAADRTTDERTGAPFYRMRVRVTPEGAKIIASKKLDIQPGMPVDLFVKTGERTMMSYLLKPLMDRAKTSMTEE